MKKWSQKYNGRTDIQLVAIHTVFEGHALQTPKRLRQYVKEKNITYPVGIDDQASGQRLPETMILYRTRGTPEMAIIDKEGKIRFQHFGSFNPGCCGATHRYSFEGRVISSQLKVGSLQ